MIELHTPYYVAFRTVSLRTTTGVCRDARLFLVDVPDGTILRFRDRPDVWVSGTSSDDPLTAGSLDDVHRGFVRAPGSFCLTEYTAPSHSSHGALWRGPDAVLASWLVRCTPSMFNCPKWFVVGVRSHYSVRLESLERPNAQGYNSQLRPSNSSEDCTLRLVGTMILCAAASVEPELLNFELDSGQEIAHDTEEIR